jgi:uridine phosphorylase
MISNTEMEDAFNAYRLGFTQRQTLCHFLFGKTGKRIESDKIHKGITATAGGFTVPKDVLRLNIQDEDLNAKWTILNLAITKSQTWKWKLLLFILSRLLGHNALSLNAIIANRASNF